MGEPADSVPFLIDACFGTSLKWRHALRDFFESRGYQPAFGEAGRAAGVVANGHAPLAFPGSPRQYLLSERHRNHT